MTSTITSGLGPHGVISVGECVATLIMMFVVAVAFGLVGWLTRQSLRT